MKSFVKISSAAAAAILALSLGSTSASAAPVTVTTTFSVSATVQATCLVSATGLSFGTYTGAAATATSSVSVTCTNTTGYNVGLSAGGGGDVATRAMSGPNSSSLSYSLFTDSNRTTNWGNTVGTDTVGGTGNGSAQSLTVYGKIPGGQYVAPGSYSDTITATVTY